MNIKFLAVLGIVSMNCFGFLPNEYSKKVQSVVRRHIIVYTN
ncbi:hypothetical protein FEM08_11710 [Flavobacterium gilvum]|nr:hypothetical protein FEM08_11710 [Flavobacterium gilvum]